VSCCRSPCTSITAAVSERSGTAWIFLNINKRGDGSDIHASREEASGAAIWDLPGRVADVISAQLRVHMIIGDGAEFAKREDKGLSTQELMAKAAWNMSRFRRENWYAARAALEQAARRAPDNPIALSMLASMETQMIPLIPFSELSPDLDRMMALCERAVELDNSNDYVFRTRGNLRLWRLGDHEGACFNCCRALAINPSFHLAHLTIATSEIFAGRFEAGTLRLQEMMRRVPFDSQNPLFLSLIALARLLSGQDDEAIEAAREGHERNPLGGWNALVLAVAASECGRITGSLKFRKMVARIELAPSHFLDLPIRDRSSAEYLASRALAAGVSEDIRA
jgi:predicted Zn-dependent protease